MTRPAASPLPELGLRANIGQFAILVGVMRETRVAA